MYRPSMYPIHYESLERFSKIFNESSEHSNLRMILSEKDEFTNDGVILDEESGKTIGFAWQYRDKYFANCRFRFETLGQYERKLFNPTISISIQCDSTETGIIVAWHEDWFKENRITRPLETDSDDEIGTVRYTKNYRIYSYLNISEFKKMIDNAILIREYNHKAFI